MTPFTRWTDAVNFFAKVHGDCSILVLGGVGMYQSSLRTRQTNHEGLAVVAVQTTCYRVAKGDEMNPLLIVVVAIGIPLICYIVPKRYPGTKLARFLSVAFWVLVGLSWLYTQYSDRERQRLQAERLQAERLQAERLQAERLQAERLQADSWVVLSLAPITIEDLAPSPDKIPDLIGLVNDPRFQQLAPWQMDLVMIKADPSLKGWSAYKLEVLTDFLTRPPKSPGLAVTVKHHGVTYRAVCSFSKLHYTDPDIAQEFADRDQPCGTLVSQYVGKTVPDWPSGSQKPTIGIQLKVGMSFDPKRQKTLTFVARPNQREEYTEEYSIWSDDSPVSPVKE